MSAQRTHEIRHIGILRKGSEDGRVAGGDECFLQLGGECLVWADDDTAKHVALLLFQSISTIGRRQLRNSPNSRCGTNLEQRRYHLAYARGFTLLRLPVDPDSDVLT